MTFSPGHLILCDLYGLSRMCRDGLSLAMGCALEEKVTYPKGQQTKHVYGQQLGVLWTRCIPALSYFGPIPSLFFHDRLCIKSPY